MASASLVISGIIASRTAQSPLSAISTANRKFFTSAADLTILSLSMTSVPSIKFMLLRLACSSENSLIETADASKPIFALLSPDSLIASAKCLKQILGSNVVGRVNSMLRSAFRLSELIITCGSSIGS